MQSHILFVALMITATASYGAAKPEISPGQYVLDGDNGTLTVRKTEQNRLTFEIDSIGSNCHTCNVSGVISGAIGRADDESDSKCEISFSAAPSAIVVRPIAEESCRYYCGMRASFDGTYRMPPTNCTNVGKKIQRDKFLSLYRARRYAQAGDTLQNLITQCKNFINWIEIDQIRNDLALAQYHNGESQQCLTTLNETLAAKVKDEEDLKSGAGDVHLPPCDFDNYIDVAKSTWFNKALCNQTTPNRR